MKTPNRTVVAALALAVLGLLVAGPTLAQGQAVGQSEVCPGFEEEHRVERWNDHPFAEGGAASIIELQEKFQAQEAELRALLDQQGLGHVADALFETVRSGTRINETEIQQGQTMRWMAFRKEGEAMAVSDVCVAARRQNGAFEIEVPVVTDRQGGDPSCRLSVGCTDESGEVSVDAASGAQVTMEGPEGSQTLVQTGSTSWSGTVQEPYKGSYTFTATASAEATETVTTYTFVVPKVCMNLGLVATDSETRAGAVATCEETERFSYPDDPLCVAPPAECAITVDPAEARTGDPVNVNVTGHWAEGGLDVEVRDEDGDAVSEPMISGPSETATFRSPGSYTIVGTATNEAGETAQCETGVEISAPLVFRLSGVRIDPDDEEVEAASALADGTPVRGHGHLASGYGLAASLEYLFNDRWGLEGRGLYGQLDNEFTLDVGEVWIMDDDTSSYWELTIGPNLHLSPDAPVDFYIGPFIGFGSLGDAEFSGGGKTVDLEYDGGFLWGAQAGLDWPFGDSQWGLHFGARYTDFAVDVTNSIDGTEGEIAVDPLEAEIGLSYRF